jgi:hypothetical protein
MYLTPLNRPNVRAIRKVARILKISLGGRKDT